MKVIKFKRGQIWWYRNNDSYDGSIQGGTRPVIIVSNDFANKYSNTLLGIPCTTQVKKNMPTHTVFDLNDTKNTALAENLMSLNRDKLVEYLGTLDEELMDKIEYNMKVALALNIANMTLPKEDKAILAEEITKIETDNDVELTIQPDLKSNRKKWTLDEKIRYVNDYENHDLQYMVTKYNEVSEKAVTNKLYRFRKEIKEN